MDQEDNRDEIQDGQALGFEIWGNIEVMSALEVIAKRRRIIDYMNAYNSPEGLRIIERVMRIHMDPEVTRIAFLKQKEENPELFEALENDTREFSAFELAEIARSMSAVTSFSSVSDRLENANTAQERLDILGEEDVYEAVEKEIDALAVEEENASTDETTS